MNTDSIQVRPARSDDRDRTLAVHLDAFGGDEGPVIVSLLQEMLDDPTAVPIHSFVAESNDEIVGHVLFTSVTIESAGISTDCVTAQILAPLAVPSELHGKGIGTHLVNEALKQLSAAGVQLVFVLGYPNYYSRFGFVPAGARGLQAPYPIPEQNVDAWMVVELQADAIESFNGEVKCCRALDQQKYWVE